MMVTVYLSPVEDGEKTFLIRQVFQRDWIFIFKRFGDGDGEYGGKQARILYNMMDNDQ